MHFLQIINSDNFHPILPAYTFAASDRHRYRKRFPCQDEATGRTKIRNLNKRRGHSLVSYIETHRRRYYALLGLPENTKQSTATEFLGRKQRRHYNIPTPLYHEIGLLKNYAESRGPIRAIIP